MSEIKETKKDSENCIRCVKCDKLLAKNFSDGTLEIKCVRCGTINVIFENVNDQVIMTDPEGIIVYINSGAEKATGFKNQEAIGKKPSELWGNHMPKELYKKMWKTIKEEGKTFQTILANKSKNGAMYDAKLVVSPILDSNGEVMFFIGTESVIKKKT